MKQPICITFAAVPGSSKTPISNYLSTKIDFPIFNNDAIRSEVISDCGFLNEEIYLQRRNERLLDIVESKRSFIFDSSVDRAWFKRKDFMKKYNYRVFIISIDLSKDFIIKLCQNKNDTKVLKRLDTLFANHEEFLQCFWEDAELHITDKNFADRLELSLQAVSNFIKK